MGTFVALVIGLAIGGSFGFLFCALLSINGDEDERRN